MKVLFYVSISGRSPVADFLESLPCRARAAVLHTFDQLERDGLDAAGVSFRHIRSKLWELRIRAGEALRIFYVVLSPSDRQETMVLLHAYVKKTRRAPRLDIEVAERRMKETLICRR